MRISGRVHEADTHHCNKKNRLKSAIPTGASCGVLREFLSRRFLVFPSELYTQQAARYRIHLGMKPVQNQVSDIIQRDGRLTGDFFSVRGFHGMQGLFRALCFAGTEYRRKAILQYLFARGRNVRIRYRLISCIF